jgi:CRISPR-associated endonuclease/helicase Cas3
MHLLVAHLLDTAAVAELMWARYLAPSVKDRLDACTENRGRALFSLICGLHDVGKASPAFQGKVPELAAAVRATGLEWGPIGLADERAWHHTLAGAVILRRALAEAGWSRSAISWVWPLVAGHHGRIPGRHVLADPPALGQVQGLGGWPAIQSELVSWVAAALDLPLGAAAPISVPPRGVQLAFAGAVIMADWIASNERQFPGVADPAQVSMLAARIRAETAWSGLGLRGGWDPDSLMPVSDAFERRFGVPASPAQRGAIG